MIKKLETLLKTREFRELNAAVKVQQCKNKLSASRDQRQRREKNVKDYQVWLKKQEEKLFTTLKNAPVGVNALEEFRMTTGKLKEKEIALFNRVQKAKISVKNSRKVLAEAKKECFEATKAKEKLKEFITIQKKKANFETVYKEEQESEFDAILKANTSISLPH
jgi:hypothetical protein